MRVHCARLLVIVPVLHSPELLREHKQVLDGKDQLFKLHGHCPTEVQRLVYRATILTSPPVPGGTVMISLCASN